jgi:hypothetical protein
VFKLHNVGDGYSSMDALLSCLQRVNNHILLFHSHPHQENKYHISTPNTFLRDHAILTHFLQCIQHYIIFWVYFAKSSLVENDLTPIRYCADDIKHIQITISSIFFSILHQIREIKTWRGR